MKKHYSNEELLKLLGGRDVDIREACAWIYAHSGWLNMVKKFVRDSGGSKQDAEDIVHDGITDLWVAAKNKKLSNVQNVKAYFFQSCKNKWYNKFNRGIKGREIIDREIDQNKVTPDIEKSIIIDEQNARLDKILEGLGRQCKEVLKLFFEGFSHEEIAKILKYENANVSKKTKSVCIKKLRDLGLDPDEWK